jgi:uncharacterized membrane protein YecN with MAPEG domain
MNLVEWIASCLCFLLVGGLYFPIPAAVMGFIMIVGRLIYAIGYLKSGPNGRFLGVIVNDSAVVGLLVIALMSSSYMIMEK